MANHCPTTIDAETVRWIVQRTGIQSETLDAWCRQLDSELVRITERYVARVVQRNPATDEHDVAVYVARVWNCILYHWERCITDCPDNLGDMVAQLEAAAGDREDDNLGLLGEVVLAVALEQMEPSAAILFERRYMPSIRIVARQTAGHRGEDSVENFAATLVMPRGEHPPRIRQYQGRTSLLNWLRVVVTNFCLSQLRRKQPLHVEDSLEMMPSRVFPVINDAAGCTEMLAPVFGSAVRELEPADRLLIKLLLLDRVPQHAVAKSLGLHSGNVTRRKQKIMEAVWTRVGHGVHSHQRRSEMGECLDAVVAGNNDELRADLSSLVGDAFRAAGVSGTEENAT